MVESLRNSDRGHAISFGEFYLRVYADKADWREVKEVLQHWNIDKGSQFTTHNSAEFDPKLMEQAIKIGQILAKQERAERKR